MVKTGPLLYRNIFFSLLVILFLFAIIPGNPGVSTTKKIFIIRIDYLKHFIGFFTLGWFFIRWKNPFSIKQNKYSLLLLLLYTFLAELIQYFIPHRSCNFIDLSINFVSLACGIILSIAFLVANKAKK